MSANKSVSEPTLPLTKGNSADPDHSMSDTGEIQGHVCPKCQRELGATESEGICHRCLLLAGLSFEEPTFAGEDELTVRQRGLGQFGDFELLEEIARGGMGIVYKARQISLNRIVAIKMILSNHLASDLDVERFRTEATATAQLEHPNIVPIYEVGENDGQHYYVMPFVSGCNLSESFARGTYGLRSAAELLRTIANAVHFAHVKGIIHRDLKPANILIDDHQLPRITDFGLAKFTAEDERRTQTGQLLGTPGFMSPEQANGDEVSPESDVYSLGAVLYVAICGRAPFHGEKMIDVLMQVRTKDPIAPRLHNPRIPRDLETICLKSLEKTPSRRYTSAKDFADDLTRFLNGEPITAAPITPLTRLGRVIRRNPVTSSLVSAVLIITFVSLIVVTSLWQRADDNFRAANASFFEAEKSAEEARISAEESERTSQRLEESLGVAEENLYLTRVSLAHQKWKDNHVGQAIRQLDLCPPEQRSWEWYYLDRICHLESRVFDDSGVAVIAMAVSNDGSLLAAGSRTGHVRIWDLESGELVTRFRTQNGAIHNLDFSEDNQLLASSGYDSVAGIWNISTGESVHAPIRYSSYAKTIKFIPNSDHYITTDSDGTMTIRDRQTGEVQRETILGRRAYEISLAENGIWFAAHSANTIKIFRTNQQDFDEPIYEFIADQNVLAIDISPDGTRIVVTGGDLDPATIVYECETGEELFRMYGHQRQCLDVEYSRDGQTILTASRDKTVRIWNANDGSPIDTLRGHSDAIYDVEFSADERFIYTGSDDGSIKFWDRHQLPRSQRTHMRQGMSALVASSDDSFIAVGYVAGFINIMNPQTKEQIARLSHGIIRLSDLFLSPDDKTLYFVDSQNKIVYSHDCDNWEEPAEVINEGMDIQRAALSPAGSEIYMGSARGKIYRHRVGNTSPPELLYDHERRILKLAISPTGQYLSSIDDLGNLVVFDLKHSEKLFEVDAHLNRGMDVTFHPEENWVASCGDDGKILIWDFVNGDQVFELIGHAGGINCVVFHPDGDRVASGGYDHTIKIWDLETELELISIDAHLRGVTDLIFTDSGNTIDSIGTDLHWSRHLASPRIESN